MFVRRSLWNSWVPKDITKGLKISQSSVQRMIKRKGIKQFRRGKIPCMNDSNRKKGVERAGSLLEIFETKPGKIEHAVIQDENDFPLQLPIMSRCNKTTIC